MVIVFDLDDTLYDELTYVDSGLNAVATHISGQFNLDKNSVLDKMKDVLMKQGRGHVFDETLKYFNHYSKKEVRKCLSVYRLHEPNIKLWTEAISCIERFKNYPLYIVTDGNKLVQHKKILALGVDKLVKKYFITYRYGLKYSKPSPHCFIKISKQENIAFDKVVYIGDNINKDFVGIKPLGFKTIRVKTGQYAALTKSSEFEADYSINGLNDLTPQFLTEKYGN